MGNFVFFHNPDEENGYLSNWYLSDFKYDGVLRVIVKIRKGGDRKYEVWNLFCVLGEGMVCGL